MDEANAFDQFDERLKLDQHEREAAKRRHHEIGDICDGENYTVGRFLQGSFRRKTMIRPLRDIDMVVLLDERLRGFQGDQLSAREYAGADGGPLAVMQQLKQPLQEAYPTARFSFGKHALTIEFDDNSFEFDVVPAFDDGPGEDADVFIADTTTGRWKRSNTRKLISVVQQRNQTCGGKFIHQVRMAKHAVKHSPIGDDFFGLLSEAVAYAAVTDEQPHPQACLDIFEMAVDLLDAGHVVDPTGEDNLARKLDAAARRASRELFAEWADVARQARKHADAGNDATALDLWGSIFGDGFPRAPLASELEAARRWQGGAPTVTGRVSDRPVGPVVAPPTRSWRSY